MTDSGINSAATLLFMGLVLNGCLNATSRIKAHDIVDESEISEGMQAAACYLDGRQWQLRSCVEKGP